MHPLSNCVSEVDNPVLWLDAGNLVGDSLIPVEVFIREQGFYFPRSEGTIIAWTHPETLNYFDRQMDCGFTADFLIIVIKKSD